jgi:predicted glycosyltransferase
MTARVLIVEDEVVLARNLAAALGRVGVVAQVAHSIAEARRCMEADGCDLVCADIQLGDGNGLDFCESLRQRLPLLPVIMMTGQDTSHNRMRSEQLGATAFVAKPFSLTRLRELVATLLREGTRAAPRTDDRRPPCVLMYSHDTIGLGHVRRNSAIASRIVARDPSASVLMLVGSPTGVPFDLPPGVDYIKLPSLTKVARNVWRPQSLRIASDDVMTLRASLIERAMQSFRPDVILVDHEPAGVWNELVPALELVRRQRPQTRIILGLRDILDEPRVTAAAWSENGTAEVIKTLYDGIFVYGDEAIFPSRETYGLDALVPGRVQSCGYVTTVEPSRDGIALTPGSKPRVVVAGGGGRDAYPVLSAAVAAMGSIGEHLRPEADLVAGPLMDDDLWRQLERDAVAAGMRFHRSHPNTQSLLRGADLYVTMGGYNSVIEAVAAGCRTLIVPRVGPSAEQRMRAQCLAQHGLVEMLPIDDALQSSLACVFEGLGEPRMAMRLPLDLNGAERAAALICSALEATANTSAALKPTEVIHAKSA